MAIPSDAEIRARFEKFGGLTEKMRDDPVFKALCNLAHEQFPQLHRDLIETGVVCSMSLPDEYFESDQFRKWQEETEEKLREKSLKIISITDADPQKEPHAVPELGQQVIGTAS